MYVTSYAKILSLLKMGDSYRLRGDYLPAWTARGYLLDLIFQSGFIEVSIDQDVSLEQFLVVSPDQHDHLRKLQRYVMRMFEKTRRKLYGSFSPELWGLPLGSVTC